MERTRFIVLTGESGGEIVVNCKKIDLIDGSTSTTKIHMGNSITIHVRETVDEIINKLNKVL